MAYQRWDCEQLDSHIGSLRKKRERKREREREEGGDNQEVRVHLHKYACMQDS